MNPSIGDLNGTNRAVELLLQRVHTSCPVQLSREESHLQGVLSLQFVSLEDCRWDILKVVQQFCADVEQGHSNPIDLTQEEIQRKLCSLWLFHQTLIQHSTPVAGS